MNPIHTTDKTALGYFERAFPGTNFRSIQLKEFRGPMSLNSYWSDGYRDYFTFVRLSDGFASKDIPQNGTPFDGRNFELSQLPEGFALAVHSYAGTRQYGSLYLNPANLTPMLPEEKDLSEQEEAVLSITRSYVSSYRKEAFARAGLTGEALEAVKASLVAKGLLNPRGALTIEGKNAAPISCGY